MKRVFVCLLTLLFLLTGCGPAEAGNTPRSGKGAGNEPANSVVFAMDTMMDLKIYGDPELLARGEQRIRQLESLFSVTDENSEIYRLNQKGEGTLSEDTVILLEQGLELCRITGRALDLSIYPVLRSWGFTTGQYQVPDPARLAELLARVDYQKIRLDASSGTASLAEGMQLDLGSIAKGYTGDCLIRLFREEGVTSGILNLGGNVQTIGSKPDGSPWRIAVQDPGTSENLGIVEVADQAVITSGGYERFFEKDGEVYWHILDPATGQPARSGLVSVTIVGDKGVFCDGLSTALFVMGLDKASAFWRKHGGFEAILVTEDGRVCITEGLKGSFSLTESAESSYTLEVIR